VNHIHLRSVAKARRRALIAVQCFFRGEAYCRLKSYNCLKRSVILNDLAAMIATVAPKNILVVILCSKS
jgi:hypothetical protein